MKRVYATELQNKHDFSACLHMTYSSSPFMARHLGRILRKSRSRILLARFPKQHRLNLLVRHSKKIDRVCFMCSSRQKYQCCDALVPKAYWDRLYERAFEALDAIPLNDFFEDQDKDEDEQTKSL